MRCLVIDDNPDERSLVERMLKKVGYRAMCVSSGQDAIILLEDQHFDVALVDLGMPGLSGVDLLRTMRRLDPRMRLLVVSSFDDRHHVLSALDAGADGYVLKTDLSERLGVALQEVVAGKNPMSTAVAGVLLRHVRGRIDPPPAPDPTIRRRFADASGAIDIPPSARSDKPKE